MNLGHTSVQGTAMLNFNNEAPKELLLASDFSEFVLLSEFSKNLEMSLK